MIQTMLSQHWKVQHRDWSGCSSRCLEDLAVWGSRAWGIRTGSCKVHRGQGHQGILQHNDERRRSTRRRALHEPDESTNGNEDARNDELGMNLMKAGMARRSRTTSSSILALALRCLAVPPAGRHVFAHFLRSRTGRPDRLAHFVANQTSRPNRLASSASSSHLAARPRVCAIQLQHQARG